MRSHYSLHRPTLHHHLTSEQLGRLSQYRLKWETLARSTARIDPALVTQTINRLYHYLGHNPPEIRFCDSPADIRHQQAECIQEKLDLFGIVPRFEQVLGAPLRGNIEALRDRLDQQLNDQLSWTIQMDLEEELRYFLRYPAYTWQLMEHLSQVDPGLHQTLQGAIAPETWIESLSCHDFCIEVLGCEYAYHPWQLLTAIVYHCGWFLPFEQVCFVCDRPRDLQLNGEGQLHGEGEAAVRFADGFSVYAHRDVRLPEHYGGVHPHQWRSQWILEEPSPMIQRALIQGIGYGRLCQELSQELSLQVIDRWRECCLLRLDSASGEALVLLKMVCAKTRMSYVVRVPPRFRTARLAARWANWGEDPMTFAIA